MSKNIAFFNPKIKPVFTAIDVEQHPNREVDLDEVEEGEMVEDKLIIPEEFKNYLNQVADNELGTGNNANAVNSMNVNMTANVNASENDAKQLNQSQLPQLRQANENSNNFNQWRNPQAYQMSSPLNQPQSPPLNPTPNTPHATDMWPCTQYQQAPPPYPNYYNQNGPSASNAATHMNCNYNDYSSAMNYEMVNYGVYHSNGSNRFDRSIDHFRSIFVCSFLCCFHENQFLLSMEF